MELPGWVLGEHEADENSVLARLFLTRRDDSHHWEPIAYMGPSMMLLARSERRGR